MKPTDRFYHLAFWENIANFFGYSKQPQPIETSEISTTSDDKILTASSIGSNFKITTVIYPSYKAGSPYTLTDYGTMTKDQQIAEFKGLVYDAITRIADIVATTGYNMYNASNDEEIEDHPFLEVLKQPFGDKSTVAITSVDLFYTMILDLLIFGNSIWLIDNLDERLSQILPLSPELIDPILNKTTGKVDGYVWAQNQPQIMKTFKAEEIIHLQYIDPKVGKRFIWGKSPIEAHKDLMEILNKEIGLEKDALDKAGFPGLLAKVDGAKVGDTDRSALERIRLELTNKFTKRKEPIAVIDAELMDITTLETKLNQLEYTGLKELTIREVSSMFKIDPMFLGLTQTTNRAQAEAAVHVLKKYTIKPMLEKIEAQLNQDLIHYAYGDGVYFKFDDVVEEDVEVLRANLEMMFRNGAITPNELRQMLMNLDPLDIPEMDMTYLPFSIAPVQSMSVEPKKPEETIEVVDDEEQIEVTEDEDQEDEDSKALIEIEFDDETTFTKADRATIARQRRKWQRLYGLAQRRAEPEYVESLQYYFGKQLNEVERNLRESGKGNRAMIQKQSDDEINALLDFILPDIDAATEQTMAIMREPIQKNLLFTAEAHITAMELPILFDEVAPSILNLLDTGGRAEGVFKFAREISQTTDEALRKTLTEGLKNGETIQQLADRIALVKADAQGYRAVRIARTEINGGYSRAANTTINETVDQYGGVAKKFWYTAGPAERDTHNANEAESFANNGLPMDQPFAANGLQYPGDPAGEAGEVINCRCVPGHIIEGLGA